MRKILRLKFLIFFLGVTTAPAQNTTDVKAMEEEYFSYFNLNRETLFLHLNKTTLIPNENLWISAYVYNTKTERPNPETVNLKIGIYDEKGKHLKTHTIFVANGKGSSMLPLASDQYSPGRYYLKAHTKYMDNFKEDLAYIQPFLIMGETEERTHENLKYDLQLLPEGGHLLAGSINSVGVKLIDQTGFGATFSEGRVLNAKGREITTFQSNRFGISRFFFTPSPDQAYKVILTTVDGQEIIQQLPAAKPKGINIVSTQRDSLFLLSIRTNKGTREELEDKNFLFTVHKDGKLKDFEFTFPQNVSEVNIIINKDSLFPGVNTVTIFDDRLHPIAERMIFNEQTLKRERPQTSFSEKMGDSIYFNLHSRSEEDYSLSVSILPMETQAFHPAQDILSAFYIKPYVQGKIDEPLYYFSEENEKRKFYDLDLLLLTQGWSRYDWTDPDSLVKKNEHEVGFTITGKVEKRNEKRQNRLFIGSKDFFEMTTIEEDDSFILKNVFLTDTTELNFGLIHERNSKLEKPKLTARIIPGKEREKQGEPLLAFRKMPSSAGDVLPQTYTSGIVELDTVAINTKKQKFNSELQVFERGIEITDKIANQYHDIADFIASQGFQVRYIDGELEIRSYMVSTISGQAGNYGKAASNVMLYFNGVPVGTNASFINRMPTSHVESIIINKMGHGYGGQGVNGVIHINTKQGEYVPERSERVLNIVANNGYTPNKEFYTPKYVTIHTAAYKKYAAINWISNLIFDEQGKAQIPLPEDQSVRLFVQGMGGYGQLISEEYVVEKHQNP